MKYSARVIGRTDQRAGVGWGLRVGVFRHDGSAEEQIGEYLRNYSALFHTFCPFQIGDLDYALYSPQYHVTRVMGLPACKDIGGEDLQGEGFCPTDYYVPSYIDTEKCSSSGSAPYRCRVHEPSDESLVERTETWTVVNPLTQKPNDGWTRTQPLTPRLYYSFGFVAGCVWGDDTTWKIQYLDLSYVQKGVVRRDDRFGYIELPD